MLYPLKMSSKQHSVKGKGTDAAESRRRRDDKLVQLRKNKREEGIEKKRKGVEETASVSQGQQEALPPISVPTLDKLTAYCNGECPSF